MFLAEYDAVMKRWSVPYDEMDITNRFGVTHHVAIAPGPRRPCVVEWLLGDTDDADTQHLRVQQGPPRNTPNGIGQTGNSSPAEWRLCGAPTNWLSWLGACSEIFRLVGAAATGLAHFER